MAERSGPQGPGGQRLPGGLDFSTAERDLAPAVGAATVVIVRPSAGVGLEIFFVQRHLGMAFMGGAVVFPGGKLDLADSGWAGQVVREPDARGALLVDGPDPRAELRALAVAACREALEEAAIGPVMGPGGEPLGADETLALREELDRGTSLAATLATRRAALDLGALTPLGRWVTPEAERRRYDARFFLLELPPGQEGRHDGKETTRGVWDTAEGMLARFAAGEVQLAPPTTRTLELLRSARTPHEARSIAEAQSLLPICPLFLAEDPPVLALPGDPAHPVPHARVAGPSRFVLRDGRFVSEGATAGYLPSR